MRLKRESIALAIIDVQERLMPVIDQRAAVEANLERLVRGAHVLGLPVIVTEQYVRGLGSTVASLRSALEETSGYLPIEKDCFSAAACEGFRETLGRLGRPQVLVAGVETHVCVLQTCLDLLEAGLEVAVAADAVSSRTAMNRDLALRRLERAGVTLVSTEMALFELLRRSGTDEFRSISRLVR